MHLAVNSSVGPNGKTVSRAWEETEVRQSDNSEFMEFERNLNAQSEYDTLISAYRSSVNLHPSTNIYFNQQYRDTERGRTIDNRIVKYSVWEHVSKLASSPTLKVLSVQPLMVTQAHPEGSWGGGHGKLVPS